LALVALLGVLVLGVLPGLIVAVILSLIIVVQRLSRPPVAVLARDVESGVWRNAERHPDAVATPGTLAVRAGGPLVYANSVVVKERLLELAHAEPRPTVLVLDLSSNDELDVEAADMLAELSGALAAGGVELKLASLHAGPLGILSRSGLTGRVAEFPTLDAAVAGR